MPFNKYFLLLGALLPLCQTIEARGSSLGDRGAVLLLERRFDGFREGFSFDSAERLCRRSKQRYQESYFSVSCEFTEKIHRESFWDNDAWAIERWRWRRESTWELRVYGSGLLAELPWKTLWSSLEFASNEQGNLQILFGSYEEAFQKCVLIRESLMWRDPQLYQRSVCRISMLPGEASLFFAEIKTQNPLVP